MDLYQPSICNPHETLSAENSPMCPQPSAFLPKIHQYDLWPPWQTSASRSHEDSPGLPSDRSLWPMSLLLLLHCFQSGLRQYHLCNTYWTGQCISIPFLSWDCSWVNMAWLERVQKLHLMADEDLLCFELLTVSLFDATPKGRELHKTEKVRAPHLIQGVHIKGFVCFPSWSGKEQDLRSQTQFKHAHDLFRLFVRRPMQSECSKEDADQSATLNPKPYTLLLFFWWIFTSWRQKKVEQLEGEFVFVLLHLLWRWIALCCENQRRA